MRKHFYSRLNLAAVCAVLASAGGCAAPSGAEQPGAQEQAIADRSNYIVSLNAGPGDISTPEGVERARQNLDQTRERVLTHVFGADGYTANRGARLPHYGQSFISAYAFEMRLTVEEAQRLSAHEAVHSVMEDELSRPTGAPTDG